MSKFALMTIAAAYQEYLKELQDIYEEREAVSLANWVFECAGGITRTDRITHKKKEIDAATHLSLKQALAQLLQQKPVQYVLSEAWFYKLKLFVNEHVLIPRPETEELVEWIMQEVTSPNEKLKIIDVGTGSGCIAIALQKCLSESDILAIDVSANALAVAGKNACELAAGIRILQMDFLDENQWAQVELFDIIVSNPPYIADEERTSMATNVVGYEPHLALFVSNTDRFIFYKKIALFARKHLFKEGKIYAEVHEDCADEVKELFNRYGLIAIIKKDMYGKNRMVSAHW